MDLLTPDKIDWSSDNVIVRGDLDVDPREFESSQRIKSVIRTVRHIVESHAHRVVLIGYRGRPDGKYDPQLSLQPLADYLSNKFDFGVYFVDYNNFENYENATIFDTRYKLYVMDNLRFWPGEDTNSIEFAEKIIMPSYSKYFVNEAFSNSHRNNASIVGIPRVMKELHNTLKKKTPVNENSDPVFVAGFRFAEEIEHLEKIVHNPQKPVMFIISGVKEDKLKYVDILEEKDWVDKILVGGRLPEYLPEQIRSIKLTAGRKVVVAGLNQDKEDITINSINVFSEEIAKAKTLVLAGPLGKFEEEGQSLGTQRVLEAIEKSQAFKVAGGGDSEKAIKAFGKEEAFDWISVGGGAMLEYFANGTLPGLDSLKQ